jgi:hypothetical protein
LSLLTDSAIDDPEIAANEPTILLIEVDVKRADNINQRHAVIWPPCSQINAGTKLIFLHRAIPHQIGLDDG